MLYRFGMLTCFLNAICQLLLAQNAVCDQANIFDSFFELVVAYPPHALATGNTHRVESSLSVVFFNLDKGLVAAIVDDLQ